MSFEITYAAKNLLMNSLIPPGSGIDYKSVVLKGDSRCAALFTGGHVAVNDPSTGFPDEGFILSTGKAKHLINQDSESTTTNFNTPGDPQLLPDDSQLSTEDACSLQFEFKCQDSTKGFLDIGYVFASDEYKEFSFSQYLDGFALLLNDANIATVPLSNGEYVAVGTVNQSTNSQYFVSNSPINQPGAVVFPKFEADGFTKKFTASGTISSGWNTMKLGVTDVSDAKWDSWVILEQGAFQCVEIPTAPDPVITLTVPDPEPSTGTGSGDPHFRTFDNQFFSYHGQCDLVLTRSSRIDLDVHIRTTRVDNPHMEYSYISGAAIKAGSDVFEVFEDGELLINGETNTLSAGVVFERVQSIAKNNKGSGKRIIVYTFDLGNKMSIEVRVNTKVSMLFVDVNGAYSTDSEGLLGASPKAGKPLLARDGETDLTGHWNTFGEEWQVNDTTDPKLFHDMDRHPQYPTNCIYASNSNRSLLRGSRRHLMALPKTNFARPVSHDMATKACAHAKNEELKTFCVLDVMATGDLELAEDPFY